MNDIRKSSLVMAGLTVLFAGAAFAFMGTVHSGTHFERRLSPPRGVFTNTATFRLSVGDLTKAGADLSGLDCYACHDKKKPVAPHFDAQGHQILSVAHRDVVFSRMNCAACHTPAEKVELKYDAEGRTIVPKAHLDNLARHGSTIGNDYCFNCHDAGALNELHTSGGKKLKLSESTLLCGSCHGPTYRDWEAGVHGRRNGFWNTKLGPVERKDCTSCHDPHAPAIPRIKPLPPPFHAATKEH